MIINAQFHSLKVGWGASQECHRRSNCSHSLALRVLPHDGPTSLRHLSVYLVACGQPLKKIKSNPVKMDGHRLGAKIVQLSSYINSQSQSTVCHFHLYHNSGLRPRSGNELRLKYGEVRKFYLAWGTQCNQNVEIRRLPDMFFSVSFQRKLLPHFVHVVSHAAFFLGSRLWRMAWHLSSRKQESKSATSFAKPLCQHGPIYSQTLWWLENNKWRLVTCGFS